MIASGVLLAACAALWAGWRTHVVRRCLLRFKWASVVRSAGLARVERRRPWPGLASTAELSRVERIPTIYRGHLVPGVGVRYQLRPARGGSLADVAVAAEALAAGLGVARVEVARVSASRGVLTAVWR